MNLASDREERLIGCLDEKLRPFTFERMGLSSFPPPLPVLAAWKRRTWNTNRGVVVISWSESDGHPGQYAKTLKKPLAKTLGFVTFFYPLGLQIVLVGNSIVYQADKLETFVDKLDDQRVVLQSIHVVDPIAIRALSAHTWGQYVSGRFQGAIRDGIQEFLETAGAG